MDGMPTDQRRGIVKGLLECFATSLVGEVIHKSNAGSPYFRATVRCSRDERRDGSRAVVEKVGEGLLANGPDFGIQRTEVPIVNRVHGSGLLPNVCKFLFVEWPCSAAAEAAPARIREQPASLRCLLQRLVRRCRHCNAAIDSRIATRTFTTSRAGS